MRRCVLSEIANRIRGNAEKFCTSDTFILFTAAICFIFYLTPVFYIGTGLLLLILIYCLFFMEDGRPVFAIAVFLCYTINQKFEPDELLTLIYAAIPFAVLVLCGFVYRGVKTVKKGATMGGLGWGICIVTLASVFSGLIAHFNWFYSALILICGAVAFMLYFLLRNNTDTGFKRFAVKCVFYMGILIALELLVFYLKAEDFWDTINRKDIYLGWGISNTAGMVLAISLPAGLYLSVKGKIPAAYMFASMVIFVALLFTFSRGNILFTLLLFPFMICYVFYRSKKRLPVVCAFVVGLCLVGIAVLVFRDKIYQIFKAMIEIGLDDRGRLELYKQAIQMFLANPIFGAGLEGKTFVYLAHNSVFQQLATGGLVAFFGMIPLYYQRYRTLLKRPTEFTVFACFSTLLFDLYGLMDINSYVLYLLFVILGLGVAAENEGDDAECVFSKLTVKEKYGFVTCGDAIAASVGRSDSN